MGTDGSNVPPLPEKMDIQLLNSTSPWQRGHTRFGGKLLQGLPAEAPMSPHPEVHHWHISAVRLPHNGGQILKVRGEEGPVGGGQAHGPGLLVALEVGPPNAAHVPFQRIVECNQMQLEQRTFDPDGSTWRAGAAHRSPWSCIIRYLSQHCSPGCWEQLQKNHDSKVLSAI